ncbi:competence damage-inducible protein A [Escherichia coli]|uniref:Competence damage-inducible protein A n=1 Tax=Escherichia coli TaxID=562 RepID=A0A377BYS8_ECOLX|nr:competence damage-inducible protein A [Escherichia coli]
MTDSELMQLSEQVGQALKARGATVNNCRVLYRWLGSESDYRYCR